MILTRQGNKTRIADKIYLKFPAHKTYVELFFGAGGMFFNKPVASNNICNDFDNDVFNLWNEVKFNKDALFKEIETLPLHNTLWNTYKNQKPIDPTLRAAIFLFYSNFGYMGKPNSLHFPANQNYRDMILNRIDKTFEKLKSVLFMNEDFRNVLNKIHFRNQSERQDTFIYSDPPYLGTLDYGSGWNEKDSEDCFDITFNSGMNAAMSEFDHPFILQQVKERGLHLHIIGERQNMKNRRTEILITNYQTAKTLF